MLDGEDIRRDSSRQVMGKVLLITSQVPHYRIPLFESVGKLFDLSILHQGPEVRSPFFKEHIMKLHKIGPLMNYRVNFDLNTYDVVIIYANLRLANLYNLLLSVRGRKFKVILYGIGVTGSYTKKYDSSLAYAFIMKTLLKIADAGIFYDNYPVVKYSGMGVDPKKLFVAFNTVVGNQEPISTHRNRSSIVFVGSLYLQKGIQLLLDAYKLSIEKRKDMPVLDIIGEGPERLSIEKWINENGLGRNIRLHGSIVKENELARYFKKALMCISPGQAGLSVQKSFSYGVPFVTSHYPISGGEFSSIIDRVTGFYYDSSVQGLATKMMEILDLPDMDQVYLNCRCFYENYRSPEVWLLGFSKAIEYALSGKVSSR